MPAPVNVLIPTPSISIPGWDREKTEWIKLNSEVNGNAEFSPLTIKAAYLIGVIHSIASSAEYLLTHKQARQVTYYPAIGVLTSGIELLGRSINGNRNRVGNANDLAEGFRWLAYKNGRDHSRVVATSTKSYNIDNLLPWRHFSAHGQATAVAGLYPDYEILQELGGLLPKALEAYWSQLQSDKHLCNMLGQANIMRFRSWPIQNTWVLFERDTFGNYRSLHEIFSKFKLNL